MAGVSQSKIAVWVPALLDSAAARAALTRQSALGQLLAYAEADVTSALSLIDWLGRCFDLQASWGVAPTEATAISDLPAANVYRADPMALVADRQAVHTLYGAALNLSLPDARLLAQRLNDTFVEDGIRIHVAAADRWYLNFDRPRDVRTQAPDVIRRFMAHELLPVGADGRWWRRLFTEMQMVLHGAPVNARREADGLPRVNAVWLWGEGQTAQPGRLRPDRLAATQATTGALADLAGISCVDPLQWRTLDDVSQWWSGGTYGVLVLTRADVDWPGWRWLSALMQADRRLGVDVVAGQGRCWHCRRAGWLRRLRGRGRFEPWLADAADDVLI